MQSPACVGGSVTIERPDVQAGKHVERAVDRILPDYSAPTGKRYRRPWGLSINPITGDLTRLSQK